MILPTALASADAAAAAAPAASGGVGPALTVAAALASGMVAQVLARHLQVPGIVLLLLVGVLLGPEVSGIVRPETLGAALEVLVGMSVAVILFEGGLSLSLDRLLREAGTIRRLITVGAVVTAAGGALAARYFMGWSWELAVPFGTLVVVTGPTVINPILRRVRIRPNVATILEGEGVLIDALGAIAAVVALEVVLAATAAEAATGLAAGLPGRLLVGAGLGISGGFVLGLVLKYEQVVPEGLENIFTLSLVLTLFELSEALFPETGIMTAAVAGLVVGNMDTGVHDELKEFKEQLTVLLIGLLFVLLAATVELEDVVGLGWPGAATVAVLVLVVRPLNVLVSTAGSDLTGRERAFLAWLAPRGIVAAAVASLFARWLTEEGVPGGAELQALVFLVIAVTVVLQGGLAGPVASLLGVRREADRGWVLVGANPLGRALARALRAGGEDVVLVDSSAPEAESAEREGLTVVYGNAAEERTLRRAEVDVRRGLAAVTPNQAVNLLVASTVREHFGDALVAVGLSSRMREVREAQVGRAGGRVLFGEPVDLEYWIHGFRHGQMDVARWRYRGETEAEASAFVSPRSEASVLPLVVVREGGNAEPIDDSTRVAGGEVVYFAWPYTAGERAGAWLARQGWEPAAGPLAEGRGEGASVEGGGSGQGEGGDRPSPKT